MHHRIGASPGAAFAFVGCGVGFCVARIPGDVETMKPWFVRLAALQRADSQLLTLVTLKAF